MGLDSPEEHTRR